MGLATDYCVKFTALDAVKLGFETKLILPGCRGVQLKPGDIVAAIEQMRTTGVQVIHLRGLLKHSRLRGDFDFVFQPITCCQIEIAPQ